MITHGIRTTYVKGCHCEDCTTAEREYQRARRAGTFVPQTTSFSTRKAGMYLTDRGGILETWCRTELLKARGML